MSFDLGFFAAIPGRADSDVVKAYKSISTGCAVEWASDRDFEEFLSELNEKYLEPIRTPTLILRMMIASSAKYSYI